MIGFKARKKQARRLQDTQPTRWFKSRRWLLATYGILLLSFLIWALQWLTSPNTLAIKKVTVQAASPYIHKKTILQAIAPYLNAGFFSVNIKAIQQRVLQLPWVAKAYVGRVWPDGVRIQVVAEEPIARWENKALVDSQGHFFYPDKVTSFHDLPILIGPKAKHRQLFHRFQKYQSLLASYPIQLREVKLTEQNQWVLGLNQQISLQLGHNHVIQRLQRFLKIYPKVFQGQLNLVQCIDMRYTNGMAVRWRKTS
jgi:cell division protein FtsQ